MSIPIVPKLLRAHLSDLSANNARIDGRSQWEGRNLVVEHSILPRAEGSARVRMGDTIVLAGVKFQIMQPYPDRPNQGGLMCSADVRPIAGRNWEAGPPSPEVYYNMDRMPDAAGLRAEKDRDARFGLELSVVEGGPRGKHLSLKQTDELRVAWY